jgi:hypothetical protein
MSLEKDSLRLKRRVAAWDDDFVASLVAAYCRHLIPLPSGAFLCASSMMPLSSSGRSRRWACGCGREQCAYAKGCYCVCVSSAAVASHRQSRSIRIQPISLSDTTDQPGLQDQQRPDRSESGLGLLSQTFGIPCSPEAHQLGGAKPSLMRSRDEWSVAPISKNP